MKRRMAWILLIGVLMGIVLSGLYKHFVTEQIMDGGGGMENPDAVREDELQILDGDHTYVDNGALWERISGAWSSEDGRWALTLGGDQEMTLTLGGETVLSSALRFTYLQPGEVLHTELFLDDGALAAPGGTALGEIEYLCHEAGDGGSGTLRIELELPDGAEETVKLQKTEE